MDFFSVKRNIQMIKCGLRHLPDFSAGYQRYTDTPAWPDAPGFACIRYVHFCNIASGIFDAWNVGTERKFIEHFSHKRERVSIVFLPLVEFAEFLPSEELGFFFFDSI